MFYSFVGIIDLFYIHDGPDLLRSEIDSIH